MRSMFHLIAVYLHRRENLNNRSDRIWVGTAKEFTKYRFRIVEENDIVVIDGRISGWRRNKGDWLERLQEIKKTEGVLIIWDEEIK